MNQTRRCDWLPELVHVDGAILRVKGLICLVFLLLSHTPRLTISPQNPVLLHEKSSSQGQ